MSVGFYRAFEDKYRGTRELIKSRLRVYLPFVEPLKTLYPACKAVDLGCGRGEWLELLKEVDIDAHGVDLDESMLAACRELHLPAVIGDAISYLKVLPDESVVIVSGFHLAEHIPFPDLQILVQEAKRVLKPAGLLILETPNPENIVVGTVDFYLDPTHQRPIPPRLLEFLPEHYGFSRVKILRLQESPELVRNNTISLLNVLNGVSRDYAIVAQKIGANIQMAGFNPAFERVYGLDLETLAGRFDARAQSIASLAESQANAAEAQARTSAAQALVEITRAEARLNAAKTQTEIDRLRAASDYWQAVSEEVRQELQRTYASRSWRITSPLRGTNLFVAKIRHKLRGGALIRWLLRPLIKLLYNASFVSHVKIWSMKHPYIRTKLIALRGHLIAIPVLEALNIGENKDDTSSQALMNSVALKLEKNGQLRSVLYLKESASDE